VYTGPMAKICGSCVSPVPAQATGSWVSENTPPWLQTTILLGLFGAAAVTAVWVLTAKPEKAR